MTKLPEIEGVEITKIYVEHYRVPFVNIPSKGSPSDSDLMRYQRGRGWQFYLLDARETDEKLRAFPPLDTRRATTRTPPNEYGGCTVCVIEVNGKAYEARAYCSFSDHFCYRTGRTISQGRAMKAVLDDAN